MPRAQRAQPNTVSAGEHRRYHALDLWRRARERGISLAANDPLERAACREANAEEPDRLATAARTPREAVLWRAVADTEMAEAVAILAAAQRSAQTTER